MLKLRTDRVMWCVLMMALSLTACSSVQSPPKIQDEGNSEYISLDEQEIECYKNTLYFLFSDANITADSLNVQSVNCSQNSPYGQWELKGTYFENDNRDLPPKTLYFHEIRGGRASSGSDTRYEVCLIIDNQTLISKSQSGRQLSDVGPASCKWQESPS